jgi:UTP-glucose-1-phosphate uridylyltransferase
MGNKSSQTQQEKTQEKTQVKTYTQVTIKDLNNVIYNVKNLEEQNKKLKEDKQLTLAKEYLYSFDLGKLLLDAANKKENKVQIVSTRHELHKYPNNTYRYSDCDYDSKNDKWIMHKTEKVLFTNEIFEQLFDEYKIFVKDVLKIDVDIKLVKSIDVKMFYYEASWD